MWKPGCLSGVSCWRIPLWPGPPAGLCLGFPGISSWHSSPFPGPLPTDSRALALDGWVPQGAQALPQLFLPPEGGQAAAGTNSV